MEDLCTSCLCSGRKLLSIYDTKFYDLYNQILNEIPWYTMSAQLCIKLCWECRSALHKFQTFKLQAQSSYVELLSHLNQVTQPNAKETRLNTHHIINLSCPEIKLEPSPLDDEDSYKLNTFTSNNSINFIDYSHSSPIDYMNTYNNIENDNNKYINVIEPEPENKDFLKLNNDNFELLTTDQNCEVNVEMKVDCNDYNDHCEETFVDEICTENWGRKVKKIKKKDAKKKAKLKKSVQKKGLNRHADLDSSSELVPLNEYKKIVESEDGIQDNVQDNQDDSHCDMNLEHKVDLEEQPPLETAVVKPPRNPRDREKLEDKPTCAECGKKFSSKKTYRYHVRVLHKGQNKHTCPRCGKVYQWKSNLGRHMRSHKARDSGELYCGMCDKRFSSVATFRQHLKISRQHISESDFSFMCNECGQKFVSKVRLRDHIDWEHLKKIKFKCELCDKPFKCHTSLYIHMKNVHVDEKQKKLNLCHVCGKAYQNAAKLKDHIVAMHSDETPHRCRECGASFGWYSSLYRHIREQHHKIKLQPNKKKPRKTKRIIPILV